MQFATRLQALKLRSNRSYEALARRIGASSSTLHRYCRGMIVPSDYAIIDRFAKVCGATDDEATALLRSWVLATGPAEHAAAQPAPIQPTWPPRFILLGLVLAVATYLARRSSPRRAPG
jgi:transcriptional regulator with XRE-family HTH domain